MRGFTLVEVVVVIAIISITLPVVFSVMTIVAKQQGKIFRLSEAKQQGDFALSFIRDYIQSNAEGINREYDGTVYSFPLCIDPGSAAVTQNGSDFYFPKRQTPNEYFRILNQRATIALDGGGTREISQIFLDDNGETKRLTTNNVKIENFEIECYKKNEDANLFVKVAFIIYYTGDSDAFNLNTAAKDELAILNYKTVVQLR
ncbi:MAG: prepilin-type N-terminal cleavage/methylation domain-containing protein [Patescibacteria group bacterium]